MLCTIILKCKLDIVYYFYFALRSKIETLVKKVCKATYKR